MKSAIRFLTLCIAPLCVGAVATAQGHDDAAIRRMLDKRNREVMHPDEPLKLVGTEGGDNQMRESAAGLPGSATAMIVDAEENYRRRIAMYESGRTYHQPVKGVRRVQLAGSPEPARAPVTAPVEPRAEGSGSSLVFWLVGCLAIAVFLRSRDLLPRPSRQRLAR